MKRTSIALILFLLITISAFCQLPYFIVDIDIQTPEEDFLIPRAYAGNNPFVAFDIFDDTAAWNVTNWAFTFSYSYDQSFSEGGVVLSGVNSTSNRVYFLGATQQLFKADEYWCEIVGVHTAGYKKTFASGKLIEIYSATAFTNVAELNGQIQWLGLPNLVQSNQMGNATWNGSGWVFPAASNNIPRPTNAWSSGYVLTTSDGGTTTYAVAQSGGSTGIGTVTNILGTGGIAVTAGGGPEVTVDGSAFATGTPLYVEAYTGDFKSDGSVAMTGDMNGGGNAITNTTSIAYAGANLIDLESWAVNNDGVMGSLNADRLDGFDSTVFATGTPVYVERDLTALADISNRFSAGYTVPAWDGAAITGLVSGGGDTFATNLIENLANVSSVAAPTAADVLTWNGASWSNTAATGGGIDPAIASNSFVNKLGDTMTGNLHLKDSSLYIDGAAGIVITTTNEVLNNNNIVIGHLASGGTRSVSVGTSANGTTSGSAIGYGANSASYGVALGRDAKGFTYGSALGYSANGILYGLAIGSSAVGGGYGVGIGRSANGSQTNIAIGFGATTLGGARRIAIGVETTNEVNNSAAIRGSLYLDGGTAIYHRATFGTGNWTNLFEDMMVQYKASRPSFLAQSDATELFAADVATQIICRAIVYQNGTTYNTNTAAWTPPAGMLEIGASYRVYPDGGSGNEQFLIYLYRNGANWATLWDYTAAVNGETPLMNPYYFFYNDAATNVYDIRAWIDITATNYTGMNSRWWGRVISQ
jgi:hypothetical protein